MVGSSKFVTVQSHTVMNISVTSVLDVTKNALIIVFDYVF